MLCSMPNSTTLQARPNSSIGTVARYSDTPHACITVSSLVRVSRPTVTSVPTSAAMAVM